MTAPAPEWKVTGVTAGQGRDATNAFVPGWTITYQLAGGAQGSVFVPKTTGDLEAAKQAVADDAAMLHNLTNLTSG